MLLDVMIFLVIIMILLFAGTYKSKTITSNSSYLFANRNISFLALTATLVMTEFNSATLISFASLGYLAGFWAMIMPFIFLFGLLFYALTVAKKWKAYDGLSVAGFFKEKYGSFIGLLTSVLLITAMLGFSAAYIKSLTLLFMPLFPSLSTWIVSGTLVAMILFMSIRGGLIAIIRTDIVSFIIMLIFFPAIAFFMWKSTALPVIAGDTSFINEHSQGLLPVRFVFSLVILTMFTYILAPWYGQKKFSAKSQKVAYWSVIVAALIVFLLYASAILATAFFKYRGFSCASAQEAFPGIVSQCLPHGLKGVAYAILFASSATTLTGVWSAMTAMWVGDFIGTKDESKEGCYQSILITTAFSAISYILSNTFIDQVFDKMILANIPVAALSFGLLAGFYWKHVSQAGVIISIIAGFLCGIGAYMIFGEEKGYTWYWAVYGIPISFVSGFIGSVFFKGKSKLPSVI